jgi:hypothetical protein
MQGLYLLWWVQERHVPAAVVASVMAIGEVALLLLEVPTGWFADRVGHRRSLIAGSCVQTVAMLWCWLATDAIGVLVASILVAVGDALRSGADEALLYRSCAACDREPEFQRIAAHSNTVTILAHAALIVLGGVLVRTLGFATGWLTEVAFAAAGIAIACLFVEPPPARVDAGEASGGVPAGASRRLGIRVLIGLVAPVAWMGGLETIAVFLTQTGDAEPVRLTAVVAIITLCEALGAACAAKLRASGALQMWLAIGASAMFAAGVTTPLGIAGAAMLMSLCVGAAEPLRSAALQRVCADDERARAASLASACDKAIAIVALPVAGFLRR